MIVVPDIFKLFIELLIVVIWFNGVVPDTFNVDDNVVEIFNIVAPDTFNEEFILELLLLIIILLIPLTVTDITN